MNNPPSETGTPHLNEKILKFFLGVWELWLPLALAGVWMRLVSTYNIVYCEKLLIYPFLRAVLSDLNTVSFIAILAVACTRYRIIRIGVALLYCFLLAANVDFISENDSNLDFSMLDQAAEGSFLQSTIFNVSLMSKWIQAVGIFGIFFALIKRYQPNRLLVYYVFPVVIFASLVYCLTTPLVKSRSTWKQMNLVEDYTSNIIKTKRLDTNMETAAAKQFFVKDLSGEPIVKFPAAPGTNVLMIVMESVGMDHVRLNWLPYLKSLSKEGIYYPNYYTSSANTINGEYSLLCADEPGIAIPRPGAVKAWGLVNKKSPPLYCLPHLLRSAGYKTAYMQPAALTFQKKDRFMPIAGFEEVYGRDELPKKGDSKWGEWGPDDSVLYDMAFDKISEFNSSGKPWFINIMTISTHYPANVPDSFVVDGSTDPNSRKRSSLYADQALEAFMTRLKAAGVLENTLVVITNDEVRTSGNDSPEGLSKKNHGILYILTPNKENVRAKDTFGQTDMFLSLTEYLGFPTEKIGIGRSIFRKYDKFRPIFFGNFFTRFFVAMPTEKHLLVCSTTDIECEQFDVDGKSIFDAHFTPSKKFKRDYASMMRQLVTMNHKSTPKLWAESDAVKLPTVGNNQNPATENKQ